MKKRAISRKKPVAKPRKKLTADSLIGPAQRPRLVGPKFDWEAALKLSSPPPGVLPEGSKMAMDAMPGDIAGWVANSYYNWAFVEGYTFLGYPYLSQLAQIPEYRLIGEVIATEATRKWIKIKSVSEEVAAEDKISELEAELDRLGARAAFKTISEHDSWFGRAHLYLDTGDTDDRDELKKSIGDGGKFTEKKLGKNSLRALKTVEPIWCYPSRYNADGPLKDDWYRPEVWFALGKEVHATRMITFVARPVPDIMKPAFSFGGLSLTQMAKPYVDNWLQTRQSVNDLIQAFSVMVLKTDLSTLMEDSDGSSLEARLDFFNNYRNNKGVMALDKNAEDFSNVTTPLGTLDKLQAQALEHICSVSRIPLVKYTGITPSGLNASSDGEIRVFYDTIHAYQESFFRRPLTTVFKIAQISLWGAVDEDLTFDFEPLWELDDVQLATLRKTEADTDGILIDKGVLAPEESRYRLANDPDQPYGPLDPEELPEALGPEPGEIKEQTRVEEKGPDDDGFPAAANDAVPPRKLMIIRHGATALNNDDVSVDRIRGWKDIPLSADGREEAEALANALRQSPPRVIVSSDLKRAHETAKIISERTGVPLAWVTKGFRPWNVGDYAGQKTEDAIPVLARYAKEKPDEKLPGGESFNSFKRRAFRALDEALNRFDGPVAIVTHHRIERLICAWVAADCPPDGEIDIWTFNQRGEHTGSVLRLMIPEVEIEAAERETA